MFTFVEVDGKAQVVAHLSEAFPARYFADHEELTRLLQPEMGYGVQAAIEAQVVSGTGVSQEFEGITVVTGTTAVPYATDVPVTLRKARTSLAAIGEKPTAYVLNPTDVETLDMLRADGATGQYLALEDRIFGQLPVIPSLAVTAGTGLLADWAQTRLYIREAARLDVDLSGTLFDTNQAKMRVEARANFAALRPQAIAIIDLTA